MCQSEDEATAPRGPTLRALLKADAEETAPRGPALRALHRTPARRLPMARCRAWGWPSLLHPATGLVGQALGSPCSGRTSCRGPHPWHARCVGILATTRASRPCARQDGRDGRSRPTRVIECCNPAGVVDPQLGVSRDIRTRPGSRCVCGAPRARVPGHTSPAQ